MTIKLLKNNVREEVKIADNIAFLISKESSENPKIEKKKSNSINALLLKLKVINNAVPDLIKNISFYKPIGEKENENKELVEVKYKEKNEGKNLGIKKKDKMLFLKSLTASFSDEKNERRNYYAELSARFFKNLSFKLNERGYFNFLKEDLRKINSPYIITSYVSMMLLSVVIGFFTAILLSLGLVIFKIWLGLLLIFALPAVIFLVFMLYPSSMRKSLEKNINQELPFLTIYLAAISTSAIEPSKIFSIIASSTDYPYARREIKKLVNYVNFYGYDFVNALKIVSKNSPSDRLSQLFDGLATTITSGGELTAFFSKHSETLLFDYRLEREKYTKTAETFMDIYISLIIAAPMILMMLFILMSITGFSSGILSPGTLSLAVITMISLINIGFLLFLNLKQPKF
jgi:pilus assembly protein TadC